MRPIIDDKGVIFLLIIVNASLFFLNKNAVCLEICFPKNYMSLKKNGLMVEISRESHYLHSESKRGRRQNHHCGEPWRCPCCC